MFLSIRHRVLFVHVAKTGGTSVRAALTRLYWSDPYALAQYPVWHLNRLLKNRIGAKLPRHSKAIAAREVLGTPFYDELFKFSFVRNPWDLQVSSWHHIRRERPGLLEGIEDFESFLRYKFDPERPYVFHFDISAEPQSWYVTDFEGREIVDFVGRYERLVDDFETILERAGLPELSLPHERRAKSRERDYRTYYTDETAEWIARRYAPDLERFGYAFDDPARVD